MKSILLSFFGFTMLTAPLPAQTFAVLKNFAGTDGQAPLAGLTMSGNTIYGTTAGGGRQYVPGSGFSGYGTVFKLNTDGTGFSTVMDFSDYTVTDAIEPVAVLVLSGTTLFGTTYVRNFGNGGTIFKVNTDGTGFALLSTFFDESQPFAGLTLSGDTLYGASAEGGSSRHGTVFKINTNGSNYAELHNFSPISHYTNSDGANPQASVTLSENVLYSTARFGGSSKYGTVFKVNADGTGFKVLKAFSPAALIGGFIDGDPQDPVLGNSDGGLPFGSLTISGTTLYGTTSVLGTNGGGTVFKVNTDGSNYSVLKHFLYFEGPSKDGSHPQAGLTLAGHTLYGTTYSGGSSGLGTVFQINTDGTGFTVLKHFSSLNGNISDGARPQANLTLSGTTLYGTTSEGGNTGNGTVFKLDLASLFNVELQHPATGKQAVITWTDWAFSLQTAPAISGPFTNVPGATSPYTNNLAAAQQFYRLIGY